MDNFEVPGCHLFSVRVTKITSNIDVSWSDSLPFCFWPILTQWIMAMLSKGCKPGHFESHNSLKFSLANICGLHSNFVDCKSFLEWNSLDILALCEWEKRGWLVNWFWQFLCEGYVPLIWKDSTTHIQGLTVYVKEGFPFCMELVSRKLCRFLLMFLAGLLHSLSSFSCIDYLLCLYAQFLILFHLA